MRPAIQTTRLRARKTGRAVSWSVSILSAGTIALAGVLLRAMGKGKPKPFVGENGKPLAGSISEKIYIRIGGVD